MAVAAKSLEAKRAITREGRYVAHALYRAQFPFWPSLWPIQILRTRTPTASAVATAAIERYAHARLSFKLNWRRRRASWVPLRPPPRGPSKWGTGRRRLAAWRERRP